MIKPQAGRVSITAESQARFQRLESALNLLCAHIIQPVQKEMPELHFRAHFGKEDVVVVNIYAPGRPLTHRDNRISFENVMLRSNIDVEPGKAVVVPLSIDNTSYLIAIH